MSTLAKNKGQTYVLICERLDLLKWNTEGLSHSFSCLVSYMANVGITIMIYIF